MLSFLNVFISVLSPDFVPTRINCVDEGHNQRYCPQNPFPYYNRKFVPHRSDLKVKNGDLVPRTMREDDDTIGLRFEYKIMCNKRDVWFRCTNGDVCIHVRPFGRWDSFSPWWLDGAIIILTAIFLIMGGSIVLLVSLSAPMDDAPLFKSNSRFCDD